jgi:hypothetical protein
MKKTIKHLLVLGLPMLLVAVIFIAPVRAASSVVHDPRGDVGSSAPYLDVVHAQVTEQQGKGTLLFMMVLAGPIPEAPPESHLIWPFHVDAAPGPVGTPSLYNEYVVLLRWFTPPGASSATFVGQVVDRTTSPPTVTPVPFSIDGRTVKVSVPLALLGNPTSFGWNASTRPGPTAAYVDFAPDGGCDPSPVPCALATWTR